MNPQMISTEERLNISYTAEVLLCAGGGHVENRQASEENWQDCGRLKALQGVIEGGKAGLLLCALKNSRHYGLYLSIVLCPGF